MHYVNGDPDAVRHAVRNIAPRLWGPGIKADIVLLGPDIGRIVGLQNKESLNVVAARYAVLNQSLPTLILSGARRRKMD